MKIDSPSAVVSESAGKSVIGRVQTARLRGKYWPPALLLLTLIGISVLAATFPGPIRSAVSLGGDEHFEVTKGFLWAHGYVPYRDFWNDQPPLHTALLTLLFKCFGPAIAVARGLAIAFGLSLLMAFFLAVKKRCSLLAAAIAVACLIAAPIVFQLSVSVMLEVPAIGTALWALCINGLKTHVFSYGRMGALRLLAAGRGRPALRQAGGLPPRAGSSRREFCWRRPCKSK